MPELTKSADFVPSSVAGIDRNLLTDWTTIRKSMVWILLTMVCCGAIGLFITVRRTPVYRAFSKVEALEINPNFLNTRDLNPTEPGSGGPVSMNGYLDTQVQVLQTRQLARRVIEKIGGPPGGKTDKAGSLAWLWGKPVTSSPIDFSVDEVIGKLNVHTAAPGGNILDIEFDSTDPQYAAKFVNTLTQQYIEDNLQARWENAQRTAVWLNRKLDDLKVEMEASEAELQRYTTDSGLLVTENKHILAEEKLQQVQQELSVAQADRIARESQYRMATTSAPDDLPAVIDHPPLREIQLKLTDLRRQSAELSSLLTPTNYKVQKVQAQIVELEKAAKSERGRVVERLRNEFKTAKYRQELLANAYRSQTHVTSQQARLRIRYDTLKNNVETSRALYGEMLQKTKTISVASVTNASNFRVIEPAREPHLPHKPIPILGAVAGGLGGAVLSLGTILVRRLSRGGVQRPGEAALYLKVKELGAVPSAKSVRNTFGTASMALRLVSRPRNGTADVLTSAPSLINDSFQAIVTSILFASAAGNRTFVLTSPYAKDGKTTIVSRLATTLAETGLSVLLIDADSRVPRLHELFGVPNDKGLGNIFSDSAARNDLDIVPLLRPTKLRGLSVMTSGSWQDPLGLFHQELVRKLFERTRSAFDITLVDTPPMMLTPAARLLGREADSAILILRAGKTTLETAALCQQRLEQDGASLLGTILNDWQVDTSVHEYYAVKS